MDKSTGNDKIAWMISRCSSLRQYTVLSDVFASLPSMLLCSAIRCDRPAS